MVAAMTARLRSTMAERHQACCRKRLVRASQAPKRSPTPIVVSSSRTTSAVSRAAVPSIPSLKASPPRWRSWHGRSQRSLHDHLGGHFWMDRAEVGIGSRRSEGEGELFVRVENFGLEHLGIIRARDRVRNVVAICPGYRGSHRDGQCRRTETEIVDSHLRTYRFLRCDHG